MAYWFIRLGRKDEPYNRAMYQALALEHSLIKIGFGVRQDISGWTDREKIKDYIREAAILHYPDKKYTENAVGQRAGQVYRFINEIKKNDTIICQFDDGFMREGKVIDVCKAIGSFIPNTPLEKFLEKHSNITDKDYIKFRNSIKVDWDKKGSDIEKKEMKHFPSKLHKELQKPLRRTVNDLKI